MSSPQELGAVYISVVPSLEGATGTMAAGGSAAADQFSQSFGQRVKGGLSGAMGGVTDKFKDVFHHAGDAASTDFSDKFSTGLKGHIPKLDLSAFKDVFAKAGDKASTDFSTKFGDTSKQSFQTVGKELADKLGQAFGGNIGDAIGSFMGDLKLPVVSKLGDLLSDVAGAGEHATTAISGVGDAMEKVQTGDFAGAMSSVSSAFENVQTDAQNVSDTFVTLKGGIKGTTDALGDLAAGSPAIVEALEAIGAAAAPIAAGIMGGVAAVGGVIKFGDWWADTHPQSREQMDRESGVPVGPLPGGTPVQLAPPTTPGGVPLPLAPEPIPAGTAPAAESPPGDIPGLLLPQAAPPAPPPAPVVKAPAPPTPSGLPYPPGYLPSPSPAPSPAPSSFPSAIPRVSGAQGGTPQLSMPRVSSAADLPAAGSRIGNLYAFAESLAGTPYSTSLRNDCSGMVAQLASVALGLPPPAAAQRFTTTGEEAWLQSHGFAPGIGGPQDLTIGFNPLPDQEGHTAATLPGGVHAEQGGSGGKFTLGGPVGGESPEFSKHYHLDMSGKGTPLGTANDPLYTAQSPNAPGADKQGQQGQQLGQGVFKGILQELGFPDVFGKSPIDFGAYKFGAGVLNFGLSRLGGAGAGAEPGGAGAAAGAGAEPGGLGAGLGGLLPKLSGLMPGPQAAGALPIPQFAKGGFLPQGYIVIPQPGQPGSPARQQWDYLHPSRPAPPPDQPPDIPQFQGGGVVDDDDLEGAGGGGGNLGPPPVKTILPPLIDPATGRVNLQIIPTRPSRGGRTWNPIPHFGSGGMLPAMAEIHPPTKGLVQWAEPGTGGEAFIPLKGGQRSIDIWAKTGQRLGVFQDGGMTSDAPTYNAPKSQGDSGGGGFDVGSLIGIGLDALFQDSQASYGVENKLYPGMASPTSDQQETTAAYQALGRQHRAQGGIAASDVVAAMHRARPGPPQPVTANVSNGPTFNVTNTGITSPEAIVPTITHVQTTASRYAPSAQPATLTSS